MWFYFQRGASRRLGSLEQFWNRDNTASRTFSCGEIHHKGNYEISLDFIERLNDLLRNGPNYPLPELGQSVIYREINI